MADSLAVVALISGGKDSFFSILHCLYNNHRIVALANVYPPATPGSADLNSYMYQTVGHAIIPLYEKALGLPLYRREISGSAVNCDECYEPAPSPAGHAVGGDETESLSILLTKIKSHLPEVNAVCSGAILSTYQRTRVESVATRLGLTALSYLWQYPSLPVPAPSSGGLLNDIAAVGLDARIVKVASGGLSEDHLWGSLKDVEFRKKLERNLSRFGGSELGEGGEYETLVVGGPRGFWNSRLEVSEEKRHNLTVEGGQSFIAFDAGAVLENDDQATETVHWKDNLNIPSIWDKAFGKLLGRQEEVISFATKRALKSIERTVIKTEWMPEQQAKVSSASTLIISNVIARDNGGTSTEEQMLMIKANLLELLGLHQRSAQDVLFATIILRSMADFAAVNAVYSTMFIKPNPPARVTVACGDTLPEKVNVMIHLIVNSSSDNARKGLHVQSRSYWAPANIGPYSQAIGVPFMHKNKATGTSKVDDYRGPSAVYIAGQIPLVPASMQMYNIEEADNKESGLGLFWGQTCLALQHLWRVSKATKVTWWASGIAFFVGEDGPGKGNSDVSIKAILTWLAWSKVHERELWDTEQRSQVDDEPDAWDKKFGRHQSYATEQEEANLPDFQSKQQVQAARLGSALNVDSPPFLAVQVDELPRGCSVEWQCLGLDLAKAKLELVNYTGELLQGVVFHHCFVPEHGRTISIITFSAEITDTHLVNLMSEVGVLVPDTRSSTFYTTRAIETTAQTVPCRSLWVGIFLPLYSSTLPDMGNSDLESYPLQAKDGKQLSAALVVDFLGSPVLHA